MSMVFLANPSLAHKHFLYRVVEGVALRSVIIPPKRQERIPGDFEGPGLRYLIEQIETAGGVPENDLKAIERPHSMVYKVSPSAAKPIAADTLDAAVVFEQRAMQELSGDKSEEAGLVAFATLARPNPDALRSSSLEVTQMADTPGGNDEAVKGGVDFEARVDKKASKPARGRRRG